MSLESLQRLWTVLRRDLAEIPKRPLYLFGIAFMALNGGCMSRGNWIYRSVDTSVGTTVSWVSSEFQVAYVLALIGFLIFGFFVALAAGMPVLRDAQLGVGELLRATPLRTSEYIWGRFLGALAGGIVLIAALVAAAVLGSYVVPDPSAAESYGPFAWGHYLRPTFAFLLPAVLFLSGASFALGALTRRAIVVFLLPITGFVFYNIFYWGWYPESLSPAAMRVLQWLDPSGFRWLKQEWLVVDRGIHFYNTEAIPYDTAFLLSRLGWALLGLALVAWTVRRVARIERGVAKPSRAQRRRILSSSGNRGAAPPVATAAWRESLSGLAMHTAPPGRLRSIWAVARFELRELLSQPGLYIFVPLVFATSRIVIDVAAQGQGGVFSPPILVTPGSAALVTLQALSFWIAFLTLFYVVESLRREEDTGIEQIFLTTPISGSALLIGKSLAHAVVYGVVLLATLLPCLLRIGGEGKVAFSLEPFLLVWGALLTPTWLVWLAFVTAAYSLTRNRYATYVIGLAALGGTVWWMIEGEMTWVTNWPLLGLTSWSDISVFELDGRALVLNRLMVLGLAVALAALARAAWRRREFDTLRRRSSTSPRLRGVAIAALIALPVLPGFALRQEVHGGFQGDPARQKEKIYWRRNVETFRQAALPELTHADLTIDLHPDTRSLRVDGAYDLINRTGAPLRWIPVSVGLFWDGLEWTVDGEPAMPEDRTGLHLFHLDQPLEPDASLRLGFGYDAVYPKGPTRNGQIGGTAEFVLPSGVVLTGRNPDFVPVLGMVAGRDVDEENLAEPVMRPPGFHEGITPGDIDRSSFTHRLEIRAPSRLTVNSTGALTAKRDDGERTTWIWEADYPLRVFNIIAGEWQVARGEEGTAVFYDARHPFNVDVMVEALDGARRYFSEWFHPYPWRELRLSEFPALANYARGNATNIFFSEGTGFLTAPDPRVDQAFTIAAHEAAHSWWGHIVSHGDAPGAIVLSEGGAHFATALLLEERRGDLQRRVFMSQNEAVYGEYRGVTSELPLVETVLHRGFADSMVVYNKGSWAFWMLMHHLGRENFLDGTREFFRIYHGNPDHPVLQDFLAVLRPHAADPEAYDAFVEQWFHRVEMPEYRIAATEKEAVGKACPTCDYRVRVEILNAGGTTMPVDVAAVRGQAFGADGTPSPDYLECRQTLTLGPGESRSATLDCGFEPERVVVDPDVLVLQLQRRGAVAELR